MAVIEGRGQGHLLVTDPRHHDPFTLDVTRMKQLTGISTNAALILERARGIGRMLAARTPPA
jgi:hypothetical protein